MQFLATCKFCHFSQIVKFLFCTGLRNRLVKFHVVKCLKSSDEEILMNKINVFYSNHQESVVIAIVGEPVSQSSSTHYIYLEQVQYSI